MKISKRLLVFLAPLLLAACGTKVETETSTEVIPVAKLLDADMFVKNIVGGESNLRNLSIFDLSQISFSDTPLAQMPLAHLVLDSRGYILPGRTPNITAYKVVSLMDTSKEAMLQLYKSSTLEGAISDDFMAEVMRINNSDQYIYSIDVPEVGNVGQVIVAANGVYNAAENSFMYADTPYLDGFASPRPSLSALSLRSRQELPSLPSILSPKNQSNALSQELYWFNDNYSPIGIKFVIYKGNDVFLDVSNQEKYKFKSINLLPNSLKERAVNSFNGKNGLMERVVE